MCEVGVVKVRAGEIKEEFQSLVDPGIPIPPGVTAINGITQEMLEDAPFFRQVADEFCTFIGDDILAIYNAPFDMGFIQAEMKAIDFPPVRNRTLDVLVLARRILRLVKHPLWYVAKYLDVAESQEHRALGDARVTAEVLLKLTDFPDCDISL